MSVLIKNIDMPEKRITLQIDRGGAVYKVERYEIITEMYRKDCPAIYIPTPHGRLVDVDKLVVDFKEFNDKVRSVRSDGVCFFLR